MALDIDGLRAATPACRARVHFNHAGASLPSSATLAAITDHLQREAMDGPMEAGAQVAGQIETVRADAAALLGAQPSEIAFRTNTADAWGIPFAGLPPLKRGERILIGRHEWGGNLPSLRVAAERAGASIEVIPCHEDGSVSAEALARMIDDRVRLVALTWLPANGGLINDAAAIGKVARAARVPYFIDAAQAIGQIPIDVTAIGCDVLVGTSRKFLRGPRGTALLYLRQDFIPRLTPIILDTRSAPLVPDRPALRTDAGLFETFDMSVATFLGLGVAIREALATGVPAIRARIATLSESVRGRLAEIPGVTLRDLGRERSGLVSFTIGDRDVQEVRAALARLGFSVGANGVPYTPFDMQARNLRGIVRASVSYLNTEAEIDRLCAAVAAVAR